MALRLLVAAREAGFFATAPFIGALPAVPLLGERWGTHEIAATVVMVLGVGLLLRARHHHIRMFPISITAMNMGSLAMDDVVMHGWHL